MDDCEVPTSMLDDGLADTCIKKRPRKKHLYSQILKQMEFYFSDANLRKDRYLSQLLQSSKYVSLDIFLGFNRIRAMTNDAKEIAKALRNSHLLKVSEDGRSVYRTSEVQKKENEDDCTIYVEQLPPDANHDWVSGIFSAYGKVEYVSIPKYKNKAIKGFAFVEFDTPEAAKKALEAFGSVGCCLPPQMRPDELCSITSFFKKDTELSQETNELLETSEETVEKRRKKMKENENGSENFADSEQNWEEKNIEEEFDEPKSKKMKLNLTTNEKPNKKGKGEEKESEEDLSCNLDKTAMEGSVSKKNKKIKLVTEGKCGTENQNQREEINTVFHRKRKMCEYKAEDEVNEESVQNIQLGRKKKCESNLQDVGDIKRDSEEMEQGSKDACDSQHLKKKKKKKKDEVDVSGESEDPDNDEGTTKRKMNYQEEELETVDASPSKKKRSRKRNKTKKKKEADHTHGLKIISKAEWRRLRNKYLQLQRLKMMSLKQNLARKKFGSNYQSPYPSQENAVKECKTDQDVKTNLNLESNKAVYMPGVIIKVNLSEPLQDIISFKNTVKVHPEVKYVDANEGQSEVFIRCASTDGVQKLMSEQMWENMHVLEGDAEQAYWQRIWKDREEKCRNKIRTNVRGREKLLKRAERELGKHIKFDD